MANDYISQITLPNNVTFDINDTKKLPLAGGYMDGTAQIKWTDSGSWGKSDATFPNKRGGLYWTGTSDWIDLFAEETSSDKLNLVINFGDDANPSFILRDRGSDKITMTPGDGSIVATSFSGSGASLTSLNASSLASGTVPVERLPLATTSDAGVVKVGNGISVSDGTISVTAANLGLSNAMHFIGIATKAITDGGTEDPTISGYSTKTAGDVVIDKNTAREYVWSTTGKWELLGGDESYWVSSTGTAGQFWRGDNRWSNTLTGPLNLSSSGTDRANLNIISAGDVPNDLYFGSNNTRHWSITSRDSASSNFLGIYSVGKGFAMQFEYNTGNVQMNYDAKVTNRLTASEINVTRPMIVNSGKVYSNITNSNVLIPAKTSMLFSNGIAFANPGLAAANDVGWLRILGSSESDTVFEIATGDDGGTSTGEKIVVRQYTASNEIAKEAILLDKSTGATTFPTSISTPIYYGQEGHTHIRLTKANLVTTSTIMVGSDTALTTGTSDAEWLKCLLREICATYKEESGLFKGFMSPNSIGYFEVYIYNTSAVDSTTGLPQYSYGTYTKYASSHYIFGTQAYSPFCYSFVKNDSGTWGISISGNANTAGAFSSGTTVKLTGDTTGESASSTKGWTLTATTNKITATPSSTLNTQTAIDDFLEASKLKYGLFKTTEANNIGMASNDGMLISMSWSSTAYGAQLAFDDAVSGVMKFRGKATNWGDWKTVAHSGNVATGDSNGQVKIAGTNVSVKGLGSAAYTASTEYAPSSTVSCTTANVKSALGTDTSTTNKWLNQKGEWSTPTAAEVGAAPSSTVSCTTANVESALGIDFITNTGALNSNGWKTLGGRSSGAKIAISYASSSPATWNSSSYSASLVFGCNDTKGLLDLAYSTPIVTFGGASVNGSTDNDPKWYFKLSGTSGKTYTFPSDSKILAAADGSNASGAWSISIPWANTNHPSTFPPTIGTTSTTAMAGNTTVTNVAISANVTTNANYPIVFATSNKDTTAAKNEGLQKSGAKFYFNPSTGTLYSTKFCVDEYVTLQWNSTDSSLDFVFA